MSDPATPDKEGKKQWKIRVNGKDGKTTWRYFKEKHVERLLVRRKVEFISAEKRKKRNNVEATIFQYCYHTRNNKTRYRGLMKHKLQALARGLWINMRRLLIFDEKLRS